MIAVQGMDILPQADKASPSGKVSPAKGGGEVKTEKSPFDALVKQFMGEKIKGKSALDPSALNGEKIVGLIKSLKNREIEPESLREGTMTRTLGDDAPVEFIQIAPEKSSDTKPFIGKKILSILTGAAESEESRVIDINMASDEPRIIESAAPFIERGDEREEPVRKEGKLLRGVMTEEGELVYFDRSAPMDDDKEKKQKGFLGTAPGQRKGIGAKATFEITVDDKRSADGVKAADDKPSAKGNFVELIAEAPDPKRTGILTETDQSVEIDGDGSGELDGLSSEKLVSTEGDGGKRQAPVSREAARVFREYMNETGNKELVRKIDFILKDNSQGEIKLILKPEALGNVRINLSLNENHIAGKIFVDNSSVRDIFLNHMDQINALLRESGYEDATLDVWVGQDGQNRGRREPGELETPFKKSRRIEEFDRAVPVADGKSDGGINLVV